MIFLKYFHLLNIAYNLLITKILISKIFSPDFIIY